MAKFQVALLLVAVVALWSDRARAEDEEGAEQPEDEYAGEEEERSGLEGMSLRTHFIGHATDAAGQPRLPAGEQIDALIGFENAKESVPYIVEFVQARITAAGTPGYIIQNLTGTLYNRTINSGETGTLLYKFTPAKEIDPRDYGLVMNVWMREADELEATPRPPLQAYNSTVTILDATSAFDIQSFFLVIVLVGLCAGLYHLTRRNKARRTRTQTPSRVEPARTKSADKASADSASTGKNYDADFIPAQHLKHNPQRGSGRGSSPKKAKK